jgi:hypothetical protein
LQNKQISVLLKIKEIEKYQTNENETPKYKPNLFAGSLLEEWGDFY